MPIPGTQLMMKLNFIKEKETNQDPQPEEHLFNQAALSSFCQEDTEGEEWLY
jgi:hypothetical protein